MGLFIIIVAAALTASFIRPFVGKLLASGLEILNREIKAKMNASPQSTKRSTKPPMPKHKDIQH